MIMCSLDIYFRPGDAESDFSHNIDLSSVSWMIFYLRIYVFVFFPLTINFDILFL